MSDLIITPGSGKIDFIYQSGQEVSRLESIIIDPIDGLVFSGKISASSVTSPINVTATSSNLSYPFIFASSTSTGPKSLLIDSAGGTYNPSTNTATIDVTGTATTASYANALNAANNYTVGTITGALTGTATTASYANALNAANKYTVVGITGSLFGTSSWATNATAATTVTTNANLTGEVTSIGNATTISSSAITTAKIADAAVTNAKLASSSVTIGSTAVSLGASPTVTIAGLNSVTSTTFVGALTGTATTASYANNLNAANSYTVAGITGNLTGTATTASYANALNATNQYTVGGITGSLFGTSSWATNATNALQLGGTAAASYVTLTGAQNLSDKTITGTFTGNLTGTATTASYANALNAANSYTIAGLTVNGNFAVNGSLTVFSASNVYITSSNLVVTDNIITMNALSPYQRYAGIQMYDSGSGTLSNFLWDGDGDYFFLSGSSVNGKIITGPDSQANLSSNFVPKATAGYKLGNSLIYDNGTNVGIGTTTVNQKLSIYPGTTGGISLQDSSGETRSHFFIDNTNPIYSTGIRTFNYYLDFDSSGGSQNAIRFYTGTGGIGTGTERIRITSTGNIGIGTNTPGALLEISSSTVASLLNIKGTGGNGILFVSGSGNVGIGTTVPAAKLHVNSTTAGATLLRTDGTNGTLFSVVDDLSDSLMSVNNSAGLPVLEVFADDRIVMGQYGQNDFVVVNNKVGIGTNNPANKLTVSGSVSIGESYINTTAPSNGLIVQGNVGIGTTTTFAKLVVSNGSGENIEFTPGNATVNGGLIESINRSTGTTRPDLNLFTSGASNGSIKFYTNGVNERMRVHYDGNVGIGTSSPSYKLEVYSGAKTSAFTGLSISNFNNYDGTAASLVTSQLRFAILENDTGTYNAPARTFAILESGNEANNSSSDGFFAISTRFNGAVAQKFRITAAGNVGIGTSSPLKLFHVHGNSGELIRLSMTSSYTASNGPQLSFWNATSEELASIRGVFNENNQGNRANLIFGTRTSDTLGVESKMTILHNGNVGIGTTGPGTKLEVSGSIRGGFFPVLVTNTGEAWFGRGGDRTLGTYTLQLGGSSATGTKFEIVDRDWTKVIASISGEAPLDSFLINTSGNLGIGTGSPVAKLQVNGNVSGSSFTSSISNAVGFLGTSSWATNATNALQLGGTVASSYVTLADTQSLTNKTITGTFTGALTGTATTASYANALNVANSYTVTNLTASGVGKFFGNIAIITDASAGDYSLIGHSYGGVTKAFTGYNGGSAVYGGESTIPTRIQAGGQYVISVLANGNVGIGTTSPLSKLHISGSGQTIMRLDSDTTTNVSQFQIKAASDAVIIMGMFGGSATGNNYGVTAAGQAYFGTSTLGSPHPTSLVIGNASNIPIIFSTNNVERMRIDGAGLVGIGTTVPSTLLHAYGSDGRYFTFSGTSGLFTIQRNVITTGGSNPVLSLINTQGMDAAGVVGRGTAIQLDLGYGGSSSAVGTAARGARIAALGETLYDATAANQNAALVFFTSTSGSLTEKLRIRSDGSLSPVSISSTTAGATLLRTDGTNGTLFSVVDDLSDSLMSVNNSAGLPVLEVFADDRIVAGQYGQNDLIVINNKVGIGTNNPVAKLQVTSSTSIPSAIFMGGNVGIGTTNPVGKLDVRAGSGGEIIFGSYDANYTVRVQSGDQLNFYNGASANPGYINYAGGATVLSQNLHVEKATGGTTGLVRIKADGNLGIGTTLPTTPLHVVGVISGSSFSGAGTGLTGTAANLTAGTATTAASVTNGVYTTGAQSIAGNKTFTGTTIVTGSIETAAVRETFSAVSSTSTVSIDLSTATVFNLTFTSTISAFNITNVNTNRVNSFTLITAPNGTGATIAWSFQTNGGGAANVKWASNVSPTATTTNGRFDIFSFVYNGTNWYGFTGGQNYV